MNLIEQLGGYENAKKFINGECSDGFDVQGLRDALLEYRRQHNIFEVRDYIVRINNGDYSRLETEVHQVEIVESERIKVFSQDKSHSYWVRLELFRLATTEEIQAGKRLD